MDSSSEGDRNPLDLRGYATFSKRGLTSSKGQFVDRIENHRSCFFDRFAFRHRARHLGNRGDIATLFRRLEHNCEFPVHQPHYTSGSGSRYKLILVAGPMPTSV